MKKIDLLNYELVDQIRQGEPTAFEMLFKLYYKILVNFALVYVKDKEISAEIVQETFIKLWEIRSSIDPNKSLKAFLYRCVHNNCINYIKKNRTNSSQNQEYFNDLSQRLQFIEPDITEQYLDEITNEERLIAVQKAIDLLPQQCKEVFILCRIDNLTYAQIAEKLNISVNTVKTQLQRAIAKLRGILKNYSF